MERAGEFLGATLRRMKDPEAARTWLKATWPKLVGNAMAAHIRPSTYAKGILRIEADSREWQKQAELMNQEICERVNGSWGSRLVNEVRVESAQPAGRRLAYEVDNNHIPFVRRPMSTRKP
jgi:predicted nucleic acid-binding Zn ribbon protein